jgi:homoserine O-acetyltransferase
MPPGATSFGFWEQRYTRRDADNLLSMLRTWQLNDVGATPGFGGDHERALGAIGAKATVMAGQTDLDASRRWLSIARRPE